MDGSIHRPALLLVLIPPYVFGGPHIDRAARLFKSFLSRPEVFILFLDWPGLPK